MIMISSVFAQLERDTIAERIKDNMYELAKTGRWLGGNTPLGYCSSRVDLLDINGKKRVLYKLDIIPEEEVIVKLIFNKMIELKSLKKLVDFLNKNNIKTRKGNNFTRFSLVSILKNPVYVICDNKIKDFFLKMNVNIYGNINSNYGLIAYNKRNEVKKIYKNISEWIISTGKHKGIIESSTFINVWNLLKNNCNKRFRVPLKNKSILSGIIKCKCGSYMRPKIIKNDFIYLCELKEKSHKSLCSCNNISGSYVDNIIINFIKNLSIKIYDFKKNFKFNKNKDLYELENIYKNNNIKIDSLIDRISYVDIDLIDDIENKIKILKKNNLIIKKRIDYIISSYDKVENQALDCFNNFNDFFDNLDVIDKRNLIKIIIDNIIIDGNNIYINCK